MKVAGAFNKKEGCWSIQHKKVRLKLPEVEDIVRKQDNLS
jgi:hypothetical protein